MVLQKAQKKENENPSHWGQPHTASIIQGIPFQWVWDLSISDQGQGKEDLDFGFKTNCN